MTDAQYQQPGNRPAEVELRGASWRSVPLEVAVGAGPRLRGLRRRPPETGLLLRTRSVHTIGLGRPVLAVTIDRVGTIRRVVPLGPDRILVDLGAAWIAELPDGHRFPRPGWRLRVVPILAACPES